MFIMFGMLSCHSGLVGPEAILSLLPRMEGRAFWASCPAPPHPIPFVSPLCTITLQSTTHAAAAGETMLKG